VEGLFYAVIELNMYCTRCGTKLEDTLRFCTHCGQSTVPGAGFGTQAAPARKLRRIVAQKKVAGVCAGFAEYFDMDVTLMRLIWVGLLLIPPNIGIVAYIIAWAVLPK
jgi:phage shock protein C